MEFLDPSANLLLCSIYFAILNESLRELLYSYLVSRIPRELSVYWSINDYLAQSKAKLLKLVSFFLLSFFYLFLRYIKTIELFMLRRIYDNFTIVVVNDSRFMDFRCSFTCTDHWYQPPPWVVPLPWPFAPSINGPWISMETTEEFFRAFKKPKLLGLPFAVDPSSKFGN